MKKRILCVLCIISCLLLVTGCSLTKENKNLSESKLKDKAEACVSQWFAFDFAGYVEQYSEQLAVLPEQLEQSYFQLTKEQMAEYQEQLEWMKNQLAEYKSYVKIQNKHGAMKKIVKSEYSLASDSASVAVTVSTEKGSKLTFTVTYDKSGEQSDFKVEDYKSTGQIMGKAGLNTVMCMGIVFLVLIFIALLISCFKLIGKAQDGSKKEEPVAETAPAPAVEENLADDLELVAVITAAIAAASESESADGLVVRSIVRRS